ncbi:MAG TPA: FxDxF family PEP-CTERM protein [Methylotenera sp.]|nr:FxDxF family PEP-CTERM protein [Methylotenera sp.]
MKTQILKQAVIGAVLAFSASAASAATVTFDYNYLAGVSAFTAAQSGNLAASQSIQKIGSITLTDLSDLNLGDGKTGVRSTITLNNLSSVGSGNGSLYISSYELNFANTNNADGAGSELDSKPGAGTNTNPNWRYVSGLNINTTRATPIEFNEQGNVNGWGTLTGPNATAPFNNEINFYAGQFVDGTTSTIDFLNGGDFNFQGFSVANLLPVHNLTTDALNPNKRPDAYSWIKIRSANTAQNLTPGTAFAPVATTTGGISTSQLGLITTNSNGAQLVNVLALAPVPEPETYAMMLAGLALIGFSARRRSA